MTGTELVCPNCGNETFLVTESIRRTVMVDGEGNAIAEQEVHHTNRSRGFQCSQCKVESLQENLVTSEYFHEEIGANENHE